MSELLIISILFLYEFYLCDKEIKKKWRLFFKFFLFCGVYEYGVVFLLNILGWLDIELADEFWTFLKCIDYISIIFILFVDAIIVRLVIKEQLIADDSFSDVKDNLQVTSTDEKVKLHQKRINIITIVFSLLLVTLGVYYRNISSLALIGLGFIPAKISQDKGRDFMTSYVHWLLLVIITFVVRII